MRTNSQVPDNAGVAELECLEAALQVPGVGQLLKALWQKKVKVTKLYYF